MALGPTDENTVPATFIGSYGEHEYTLNGTVQEVMAQLKELHPEVELEKRDVSNRALLKKNKVSFRICLPIHLQLRLKTRRSCLLSAFELLAGAGRMHTCPISKQAPLTWTISTLASTSALDRARESLVPGTEPSTFATTILTPFSRQARTLLAMRGTWSISALPAAWTSIRIIGVLEDRSLIPMVTI